MIIGGATHTRHAAKCVCCICRRHAEGHVNIRRCRQFRSTFKDYSALPPHDSGTARVGRDRRGLLARPFLSSRTGGPPDKHSLGHRTHFAAWSASDSVSLAARPEWDRGAGRCLLMQRHARGAGGSGEVRQQTGNTARTRERERAHTQIAPTRLASDRAVTRGQAADGAPCFPWRSAQTRMSA